MLAKAHSTIRLNRSYTAKLIFLLTISEGINPKNQPPSEQRVT